MAPPQASFSDARKRMIKETLAPIFRLKIMYKLADAITVSATARCSLASTRVCEQSPTVPLCKKTLRSTAATNAAVMVVNSNLNNSLHPSSELLLTGSALSATPPLPPACSSVRVTSSTEYVQARPLIAGNALHDKARLTFSNNPFFEMAPAILNTVQARLRYVPAK